MSRLETLQVQPSAEGAAPTPSQKRFNTLLKQIEQARLKLSTWNEGIAAYRKADAEVLQPLQMDLRAGHRQWAFALDAVLAQPGWKRDERDVLRELICEAAGDLLEEIGNDPELEALFDKHSDVDFATGQREALRAMKGLAEAMTGLDLGDGDDIDTEDDLFERLHQGMHAKASEQDAQREVEHEEKVVRRSKSAAQKRREADAQQATQSVREIYRKLASALHPDREPDEQQREVKTALMKRVNQAHEANDLLTLLELQLQIEQIDASHIASASEQRLKHYNKVLAEQLAGIKEQIVQVEMSFRMEFGLEPGWGLNPGKLGQMLEQTRREWQADLAHQQRELRMLGDAAATRRWLKRVQKQRREDEFEFMDF